MAILLGATPMTVERTVGAYVDGIWVRDAGSTETFTILASMQPINGRERLDLPEAYRTRQTSKLYTQPGTVLRGTQPTLDEPEDVVIYKGRRYEVVSVEDWRDHAASTRHNKYMLAEIGLDGEI